MSRIHWMSGHDRGDLLLLHELWMAGVSLEDIAKRFNRSKSTIVKWATNYKLPRRHPNPVGEPPAPSLDDDAASVSSLALSPWVEARARECREAHYAQRRRETESAVRSKIHKWGVA